jgi:hypothetical protein
MPGVQDQTFNKKKERENCPNCDATNDLFYGKLTKKPIWGRKSKSSLWKLPGHKHGAQTPQILGSLIVNLEVVVPV